MNMKRRSFLALLAALPFGGWVVGKLFAKPRLKNISMFQWYAKRPVLTLVAERDEMCITPHGIGLDSVHSIMWDDLLKHKEKSLHITRCGIRPGDHIISLRTQEVIRFNERMSLSYEYVGGGTYYASHIQRSPKPDLVVWCWCVERGIGLKPVVPIKKGDEFLYLGQAGAGKDHTVSHVLVSSSNMTAHQDLWGEGALCHPELSVCISGSGCLPGHCLMNERTLERVRLDKVEDFRGKEEWRIWHVTRGVGVQPPTEIRRGDVFRILGYREEEIYRDYGVQVRYFNSDGAQEQDRLVSP
jgi:hypothetical protein